MGKLRWKKQPRATGLSAIGAGPRGSYLHDGEQRYAVVYASTDGCSRDVIGWYFVAGWGSVVPYLNTCDNPVPTEDEAKKAAYKYVTDNL